MQPRIYTYKITFEEIPDWYWGSHKEKKHGESYMGSPVTHAWKWDFYTPHLQICELFPCTDEGWAQAREVEDRCIKPDLNNPLCLNEHVGGLMSLEVCRKAGVNGGKLGGVIAGGNNKTKKKGICDPSYIKSENKKDTCRKNGIVFSAKCANIALGNT